MSKPDLLALLPYKAFFQPDFIWWLDHNRDVYDTFEQQTLALIAKGHSRSSAMTIVGDIRYHMAMRSVDDGDFKISNARAADLARVFVIRHPVHALFWEYRRPDWRDFLQSLGVLPTPPQTDLFASAPC
jgi:hypothetical protein